MNKKPRRIEIKGQWYDVKYELSGNIELRGFCNPIVYTAENPYIHLSNLFYVKDSNGNKVGEIDTYNKLYSGVVSNVDW